MTAAGAARRLLRQHVGYLRVMEARNKVVLGPAALAARRFERAELARLRRTVGVREPALVATVIATFRRPETVRAAVRSALAQTVGDQVVVVVDDGGGIDLGIDDPRLVAVSLSRNCGILGVCRNVGIGLTRSTFLAFLDDDNEWEPTHLEVALAAMDPAAALVYTDLLRLRPDGSVMDVHSVPFDRRAMARNDSPADSNAIVARRTPATRFSRIRRNRVTVPPEDWELVFRLSRRAAVRHVAVPTVRYLVNPASYYTAWSADEQAAPVETGEDAGR